MRVCTIQLEKMNCRSFTAIELTSEKSDMRLVYGYGSITYWSVVWNMNFMTFHILGMSSSQLTFFHIHPASRGVAAHTAGLFRSVRGAKGGFPPWGLPTLRIFTFPPVGAPQARDFSLFPPVGAPQAKNFHFPPVGAPQAREFSLFPPVGAPQAKNFHFPPRGGSPS